MSTTPLSARTYLGYDGVEVKTLPSQWPSICSTDLRHTLPVLPPPLFFLGVWHRHVIGSGRREQGRNHYKHNDHLTEPKSVRPSVRLSVCLSVCLVGNTEPEPSPPTFFSFCFSLSLFFSFFFLDYRYILHFFLGEEGVCSWFKVAIITLLTHPRRGEGNKSHGKGRAELTGGQLSTVGRRGGGGPKRQKQKMEKEGDRGFERAGRLYVCVCGRFDAGSGYTGVTRQRGLDLGWTRMERGGIKGKGKREMGNGIG
ncbi:hypothetical protein GGR50DRAFT_316508 [Xylaria sp. CBS 124048]|nr:hypothetical protein GGR50DRAFT_316508 [Xylaria sp. CBS 124048]